MKKKILYWNNLEEKSKVSQIHQIKGIEKKISYTNVNLLKNFLTKFGKIKSRRKTFFTSKIQRLIAKTIKKSRNLALIPTNSVILYS